MPLPLLGGSRRVLAVTAIVMVFSASPHDAAAWSQATHKRIVVDAFNYMAANPDTTQYNRWKTIAQQSGLTMSQLADRVGQAAYDVDDFEDTYICGAVLGECQLAPVFSLGSAFVNYSSWWHFHNRTRGRDVHGNVHGGYNYAQLTVKGTLDDAAATWLVGDYLDDGPGGLTAWFSRDHSKYNSYDLTEAHYRQGGYSTRSMYADFEKMPFQPIDNLAQYWYGKYLQSPSLQALGFALHATDIVQPHHTWTTIDLHHSGWEGWVKDYYDIERLNDFTLVRDALSRYPALPVSQVDIRPLLRTAGGYSYSNGGLVLSSTAHADRVRIAKLMIPNAIAMTVRVLDHAALQF